MSRCPLTRNTVSGTLVETVHLPGLRTNAMLTPLWPTLENAGSRDGANVTLLVCSVSVEVIGVRVTSPVTELSLRLM